MNWGIFSKISIVFIGHSLLPFRRRIFGCLRAVCPGICIAFLRQGSNPTSVAKFAPSVKRVLEAEFHLSSESDNASWEHAMKLKALFPILLTGEFVSMEEISMLEKIKTFLQNNYMIHPLPLPSAAEQLGMKTQFLKLLLQRHLGLSFRQALSEVRLSAAKTLLDRGFHDPVKSIAVNPGFGNTDSASNHFNSPLGTPVS